MVKQEVEGLVGGFSRDDVIIIQDQRTGFRLGVERIDCGHEDGLIWRGIGRCQSGACNIADLGLERRRGSHQIGQEADEIIVIVVKGQSGQGKITPGTGPPSADQSR